MDKFPKAAITVFGVDDSLKWVEENKDKLETIESAYNSDVAKKSFEAYSTIGNIGIAQWAQEITNMTGNMYDYLKRIIPQLVSLESVPNKFKYKTFEEAKTIYQEKAIINGNTADVSEFNSLMMFIYEGRKQQEELNLENTINSVVEKIEELHTYCKNWKSDKKYFSDEIVLKLQYTKDIIDSKFLDLM